jgi:hypothetical protein
MGKQVMKGVLDFLERVGLVKTEESAEAPVVVPDAGSMNPSIPGIVPPVLTVQPDNNAANAAPAAELPAPVSLNLEQIYVNAGIAPSFYPAERLLRLIDGLGAMDEPTRLMVIRAMDAADESWTIEDPLADAAAKVQALTARAERLQLNLQQIERETKEQLEAMALSQEQVLGNIRKQMAELESLMARETARTEQEAAVQQAKLKTTRDHTAGELAELNQVSQRLQSLSSQFGSSTLVNAKE